MHISRTATLLSALVLWIGCDSADPDDDFDPEHSGIYVANQGSFTDGNGSITVYRPSSGETSTLADGLGTTIQSLFLHDEHLYATANSGNRIEIIPLRGGSTARLEVLSPRYIAQTSDTTALVTSLFGSPTSFSGGKVFNIDLLRHEVTDSVNVGDNPEGIAVVDSLAFVANSGFGSGSTVSVIHTGRVELVETIDVDCDGPRFVLRDDDPEIWVLCTGRTEYDGSGNVVGQTNGAVRIINPRTLAVVERMDLDGPVMTVGPGQDATLSTGLRQLFVVVGGDRILRYDTRSNDHIATIGPIEGDPIGALAYDPISGDLYLGRVPSFVESGYVSAHDFQGNETLRFDAGVAPTYILFRR